MKYLVFGQVNVNHLAEICIPMNEIHSHKCISPICGVQYQHQKKCFVPHSENESFLAGQSLQVSRWNVLFFLYMQLLN